MARSDFHGITDQRKAAFKRLRDARALLAEHDSVKWRESRGWHARGAMYLGGYAIECRLKAMAMEVYRCHTLAQLAVKSPIDERVIYSHGIVAIAKKLPVWSRIRRSKVWADFVEVTSWRPAWRYDPHDALNSHAAAFLLAVQRVYDWLEHNQ